MFNVPPATLWTCGILVGVFVLDQVLGVSGRTALVEALTFQPPYFLHQFAEGGPGISLRYTLPLITHALLHLDFLHLVMNVGFLLAFGTMVERNYGILRYLLIFVLSVIAGALAELTDPQNVYLLGASGGVFGLMGAFVPVLGRGSAAARKRSLQFVAIILGLNALFAFFGVYEILAGAQVAWRAHIGGFVAGLCLSLLLHPPSNPAWRR